MKWAAAAATGFLFVLLSTSAQAEGPATWLAPSALTRLRPTLQVATLCHGGECAPVLPRIPTAVYSPGARVESAGDSGAVVTRLCELALATTRLFSESSGSAGPTESSFTASLRLTPNLAGKGYAVVAFGTF